MQHATQLSQPNKEIAAAYLKVLDPNATQFTFRWIDDNKDRNLPVVIESGTLDEMFPTLVEKNQQGYGIFVNVQETDGEGGASANITRIRTVFQELDETPPDNPSIQPHIIVSSSPGKFHNYYLTENMSSDQYDDLYQRMVDHYGSDPGANSIARVLRVPGFYHQKVDASKGLTGDPHLVTFFSFGNSPKYTVDTLQDVLLPPTTVKSKQVSARPPITCNLDKVRDLLFSIPNKDDLPEGEWLPIMFAVHHETGGSEEGRELFFEWSEGFPSHKPGDYKRWDSAGRDGKSKLVTGGTLVQIAKRYGWTPPVEEKPSQVTAMEAFRDIPELPTTPEAPVTLSSDTLDGLLDQAKLVKQNDKPGALRVYRLAKKLGNMEASAVAKELKGFSKTDLEVDLRRELKMESEYFGPTWPHLNANDTPKDHTDNLKMILDLKGAYLQHNEMNRMCELLGVDLNWNEDKRSDEQLTEIKNWCSEFNMPDRRVENHIVRISECRSYHPVKTLLENTQWDGVSRFGKILDTIPCTDNKMRDILLFRWCLSAVAVLKGLGAWNQPARGVLVFVGTQEFGKSTWLDLLCPYKGGFLKGAELQISNKDSKLALLEYWMAELGELDNVLAGSSAGALKAYLDLPFDKIRPPYGATAIKFPRRTVFSGSVNEFEFLVDPTGNSRYWPVEPTNINLDAMRAMHNSGEVLQFWKEIEHHYDQGEQWTLNEGEKKMLCEYNRQFEQKTQMEELLLDKFDWDSKERTFWDKEQIKSTLGFVNPAMFQSYNKDLISALKKLTGQNRAKTCSKTKSDGSKTTFRGWGMPPVKATHHFSSVT